MNALDDNGYVEDGFSLTEAGVHWAKSEIATEIKSKVRAEARGRNKGYRLIKERLVQIAGRNQDIFAAIIEELIQDGTLLRTNDGHIEVLEREGRN